MDLATEPWQQGYLAEIGKSSTGSGLRISGAGKCVRRQTYAALDMAPTDIADAHSQNRMALGHALEVLIVAGLKEQDWETRWTVLDGGQAELSVSEMPEVKGHPDGICRHPRHTRGLWVTLECKSMGETRAELVSQDGVFTHYPDYRAQIALYARELYRLGEVVHPERGVFGLITRDGQPMSPERVSWHAADHKRAVNNLRVARAHADAGTLPDRPHRRDDFECAYCPFQRRCWEQDPPREEEYGRKAKYNVWDSLVLENPALAEETASYAAALRDRPRVTRLMERLCREHADRTVQVGDLVGGYFYPKNPGDVSYDESKLTKYLTAEQIRECRAGPPSRRFWLRAARH